GVGFCTSFTDGKEPVFSFMCLSPKRKNWIFANTPKGAKASAVTYSIVETAKENGLNPYQYLMYIFEKLPNVDASNENAIDRIFKA
ncbi:TPA: transposase domain-containing protein, partial [Bacillus cereus]